MDEKYTYCIHCEKVCESEKWGSGYSGACPYDGCDGGFGDGWSWEFIAGENDYPKDPILGIKYSMYSERYTEKQLSKKKR